MPELPEVETVRRTLEEKLTGKTILEVNLITPDILRQPCPSNFIEIVKGKKFRPLERRGKYLLFKLSQGWIMVGHLRMTGQLIYCEPTNEIIKHTHLILDLDDGNQLRYIDIRRFGGFNLVEANNLNSIKGLASLGPEPLGEDFSKEYLKKNLRNSRSKIKSILLDQTFVAGLGNIYVDEALFKAKVHPERLGSSLTPREIAALHKAIQEVLQLGIENRGTSLKDYVDGEGRTGEFQRLLQVYGKYTEPCPRCKTVLLRAKVAGRTSSFCPKCQKEK